MQFNPFSTPDPLPAFANKIVNDFKKTGKFNINNYPDIKPLPQWQRIELSGYIVKHPNITRDDQIDPTFLGMLTTLKSPKIGGKSRRGKSRRSKSRRTVKLKQFTLDRISKK